MRNATFGARLGEAITETYAGSAPVITHLALWSSHRAPHMYALARAMPPRDRAKTLAFFAGLDPQPRSDRAVRAALDAIRSAPAGRAQADVLALVPLRDDSVVRAAEHLSRDRRWLRPILQFRLDSGSPALPQNLEEPDSAAILAAAAAKLHREGHTDEARERLDQALNTVRSFPETFLSVLPAVQALGAFDLLLKDDFPLLTEASCHHAAFLAGSTGSDVTTAFAERLAESGQLGILAAAALGKKDIPPSWAPRMAGIRTEQIDEYWEEGLVSHDERWSAHMAHHLGKSGLEAGVEAGLTATLKHACSSASLFAEKLLQRWSGEGPAKENSYHQKRLPKLVAESLAKGRASVFHIARTCRLVADAGGAEAVRDALATLESKLGEATTWKLDVSEESDAESWTTILGSAAGRAKEAIPFAEAFPNMSMEAQTALCAGLARDGQTDLLRARWEPLIAKPMPADHLHRILHAANVLDPESKPFIEETLKEALDSLPGTEESIAAWLAAKDEDEIAL